jgi:Tfp pilus assembly protein PilV
MNSITWRKIGVHVLVVLPVLGLAGIGVVARQHQQDASQQSDDDAVAAAARKAREQKKEAPKPKKVYTNEDVSSAPAAAAPVAASTDKAPTAEGAAKDSKTDDADKGADADKTAKNKNDEATWRKRFQDARDKLAVAEKELDVLQREANKAQTQYYSDPQKALAEQYNRKDINEHDTQIAAKKQEVAQLKQALSDLEDNLRRSGGDIGWAR